MFKKALLTPFLTLNSVPFHCSSSVHPHPHSPLQLAWSRALPSARAYTHQLQTLSMPDGPAVIFGLRVPNLLFSPLSRWITLLSAWTWHWFRASLLLLGSQYTCHKSVMMGGAREAVRPCLQTLIVMCQIDGCPLNWAAWWGYLVFVDPYSPSENRISHFYSLSVDSLGTTHSIGKEPD